MQVQKGLRAKMTLKVEISKGIVHKKIFCHNLLALICSKSLLFVEHKMRMFEENCKNIFSGLFPQVFGNTVQPRKGGCA